MNTFSLHPLIPLPAGITGFFGPEDQLIQPASPQGFRRLCHGLAREAGGKVLETDETLLCKIFMWARSCCRRGHAACCATPISLISPFPRRRTPPPAPLWIAPSFRQARFFPDTICWGPPNCPQAALTPEFWTVCRLRSWHRSGIGSPRPLVRSSSTCGIDPVLRKGKFCMRSA